MAQRVEPVAFEAAFESLLGALGPRFNPELKEKLRLIGVDADHLQAAYPGQRDLELIRLAGTVAYPEFPGDRAHFEMGRGFIAGFERTPIGSAVVTFSRLIGPKRTLSRMTRNLRTNNNYLETDLRDVGPTEVELTYCTVQEFVDELGPLQGWLIEYSRGVIVSVLEGLQLKEPTVEMLRLIPERRGIIFRIRWK